MDDLNLNDLKQLRILELGANKLRALSVNQLPISLQELYLGGNAIGRLPALSRLAHLRILSLQVSLYSFMCCCDRVMKWRALRRCMAWMPWNSFT